ncbi:helix-turn-helix transcriptional regulator [Sphingomonas sp. R86521]|uniref:helix-turn-helix transcriptional regulator n=1 Tax=Sphingomonas sp. R86521 TaxID=3093860 RepID=UPI0036D3A710
MTFPVEVARALSAASLLADATAALDHDLEQARRYLKQLAGLPMFQPETNRKAESAMPVVVDEPIRGGLATWQVRRIAAYVETNIEATITVRDLAGITGISCGHLCRAFKVTTKETLHTYITRRRIECAQTLMLTTTDTLSQIAYACGLTDQAHLTRLFRRFVDQTPLSWRRTWRQAA